MKTEAAACSSKKLTSYYDTVHHSLNNHHCENLKTNIPPHHLFPSYVSCEVREKCQVDVNVIRMLIMDPVHCMQELRMHKQNCGGENIKCSQSISVVGIAV
jgi:hypothetical protein